MRALVDFCIRQKLTPNTITAISGIFMAVAGWSLSAGYFELALFLIILVQLSDILDGAVARAMEAIEPGSGITRFGEIADPIRDKILFIGALYMMPWVPKAVLWAGIILETALVLVRVFQWVLFKVRKIQRDALPANGWGKWKMVCENVAIIGFLLQKCRPEYIPMVAFELALVLGLFSFVVHVRNTLNEKPSQSP